GGAHLRAGERGLRPPVRRHPPRRFPRRRAATRDATQLGVRHRTRGPDPRRVELDRSRRRRGGPVPRPLTVRTLLARVAAVGVLAALLSPAMLATPAQAASRVNVDAQGQGAVIDSTYSTRLRVRGSGFQSVQGG